MSTWYDQVIGDMYRRNMAGQFVAPPVLPHRTPISISIPRMTPVHIRVPRMVPPSLSRPRLPDPPYRNAQLSCLTQWNQAHFGTSATGDAGPSVTVGLPGSGLSYRSSLGNRRTAAGTSWLPIAMIAVAVIILILWWLFGR